MTPKNVAIEPELLERAGKVAEAEGKAVDELTAEALQRELARRTFERAKREGETRCRGMTDDDVERTVEKAVQEYRAEQRRG